MSHGADVKCPFCAVIFKLPGSSTELSSSVRDITSNEDDSSVNRPQTSLGTRDYQWASQTHHPTMMSDANPGVRSDQRNVDTSRMGNNSAHIVEETNSVRYYGHGGIPTGIYYQQTEIPTTVLEDTAGNYGNQTELYANFYQTNGGSHHQWSEGVSAENRENNDHSYFESSVPRAYAGYDQYARTERFDRSSQVPYPVQNHRMETYEQDIPGSSNDSQEYHTGRPNSTMLGTSTGNTINPSSENDNLRTTGRKRAKSTKKEKKPIEKTRKPIKWISSDFSSSDKTCDL